ncbi:hypothetical protein ACFL3R_00215 [Thermodesulfobacteriota bacterium]
MINFISKLFKGKKEKFQHEIKFIDGMISQAKRFGYQFGVLGVELSHSIPRGLSKILPGKTISFSVIGKNLRLYDRIVDYSYRRYYVILPQTDEDGVKAVSVRIRKLAQKHSWGEVTINAAIYPKDGDTPQALLSKLF